MVQFNIPGATVDQYNKCWEEMRKTGHEHPKGLIHHVATQRGNDLVAVDVWESEESFNEFGKVLTPIFHKVGITPVQPQVTPVLYEQSGVTAEANH